jgi:iron complex transport system substrate-binding protein
VIRIVSLLPSATEIVCALGLRNSLVGVTHECDWPPSVRTLPHVTRSLIPAAATSRQIDTLVRQRMETGLALYTLDESALAALAPDLIITQTLCDVCAVAEDEVRQAAARLPTQPRVLHLEPVTLDQVLQSIQQVAEAAGVSSHADAVVEQLRARRDAVIRRAGDATRRPRVAVLEWIDPLFCCGHWTPELVELAGGQEGLGIAGRPARTISWHELRQWQPEVLLLACCGYSVEQTLRDLSLLRSLPGWDELPCVRSRRVWAVDGSAYFSRPGPRLIDSLEILAHLIDPQRHELPAHLPPPVSCT